MDAINARRAQRRQTPEVAWSYSIFCVGGADNEIYSVSIHTRFMFA